MQPGYYIKRSRARNPHLHPMINSVFVLLAALIVFAFGYRFFSKFLAVRVFRSDVDYSTPVPAATDRGDPMPSTRYMPFAQHIGSLASAVTIIGTTLAVAWGWIPVFLWVVVGSVVAAGTYAMGSLWLPRQHRGATPASQARDLAGHSTGTLILALLAAFSVLVNAVMALAIAGVLVAYPASAIPFLLQGAIAFVFGLFVRRRPGFAIFPGTLIALAAALLALWLFRGMPLELVGRLQIQSGANKVLTLDAPVIWIVLAFAFAWYSAHQPPRKLALPYGLLSTGLLGITLLILFIAVMIAHPMLAAPAFYTPSKAPGVLPWLFVTATSGAIGGWHALVASGISARQLAGEDDVRRVGYGGAIADALIALSAILIASAAFPSQHAWTQAYGSWDSMNHLSRILRIYIDGFAVFGHILGISDTFSKSLGALMLMCLSTTTLITGIRIQHHALEEMAQTDGPSRKAASRMLGFGALLAAALAAQASQKHILEYWPLFGSAGLAVAAALLAIMVLALARRHRPLSLVLAPLLFVLGVGIWALGLELVSNWSAHRWGMVGTCLILALALAAVIWRTGTALYKSLSGRRA